MHGNETEAALGTAVAGDGRGDRSFGRRHRADAGTTLRLPEEKAKSWGGSGYSGWSSGGGRKRGGARGCSDSSGARRWLQRPWRRWRAGRGSGDDLRGRGGLEERGEAGGELERGRGWLFIAGRGSVVLASPRTSVLAHDLGGRRRGDTGRSPRGRGSPRSTGRKKTATNRTKWPVFARGHAAASVGEQAGGGGKGSGRRTRSRGGHWTCW